MAGIPQTPFRAHLPLPPCMPKPAVLEPPNTTGGLPQDIDPLLAQVLEWEFNGGFYPCEWRRRACDLRRIMSGLVAAGAAQKRMYWVSPAVHLTSPAPVIQP